jgi:hypothetical protein
MADDLNQRQRFALDYMAKHTWPDDKRGLVQYRPGVLSAWQLGDAMKREGLNRERYADSANGNARSAGRTLSSLARRGLVASSTPGGEAFQAVAWCITPDGVRAAQSL